MTALFLLRDNSTASRGLGGHRNGFGCHLPSPFSVSHFAIYFSILICCSWQCAIVSKQCRSVLHKKLTNEKKKNHSISFELSASSNRIKSRLLNALMLTAKGMNDRAVQLTDRPTIPNINRVWYL